jgi:hypothetical protein
MPEEEGIMSPSRIPRVTTLSRLMVLNAAFALLLAAYRFGLTGLAEHAFFFGAAWASLLLILIIGAVLDLVLGIPCPRCRRLALRRLALPFSLVGFYECTACQLRCKRATLFAPWREASGPEDAAKYRRKPPARWLGYSVPEGSDSMCGTLLRSKRSRVASPPRDETRVEPGARPASSQA